MVPGYGFQVFLRVTVQNQIRIAQRVIVDKVIQLRPLCHGHIQRILDPSAVNGNVKQKRQWTVCLPVDIPTGWEPRTNKNPTGVFVAPPAVGPCCSSPLPHRKRKTSTQCVLVFLGAVKQSKSEPFPSDATSVASPKVTVCVPSL